ncbi:MAG: hypothetical protein HGN29_02770 [Asgard group archaeon]|nr:hypothetical protein [Asgard group archaeon]
MSFLLPFKERYEKKSLSPIAMTITVFLSVILMIVSEDFLSIVFIYVLTSLFFLLLGASFLRTIKLVSAAALLIFFLGLPSLFLENGLERAGFIWMRGILSASLITLYSSTITMQEFAQSLRSLFFPNLIVTIIVLILRYTPLLYQQGAEIRTAQELRGISQSNRKRRFNAVVSLLGGTLIRSVYRGGEIYEAMLVRGLESIKIVRRGSIKPLDPFIMVIFTVVLSLLSGGILSCIMK